jgi:hypothetical protein
MLQNTSAARQLKHICKYIIGESLLKNKSDRESLINKIKCVEK